MKPTMTVIWAGVLLAGTLVAQPPLDDRLVELGRQVVVQEVEMVAVQDTVRQAGPRDLAAAQARLAEQEVRVAAMLQQAKESLAQAAAMHSYAQKQMRLAKESLGRGLTLMDEAKAVEAAARKQVEDALAREESARQEAEAAKQEAAALAAGSGEMDPTEPTGPAVVYGGFRTCEKPPMNPDPWAAHRDKGPLRVPRSGVAKEFPSPMRPMPVKP